ncbi:MAG: ferrous iron transport protein B [Candidatus Izemoplasmatales bacterium]|nr:ferrous iron transport protein B [Candidatus Izemoplasmatales bacterium]
MKIALVGNPNSGKTTLFNNLTGANQSVGNWPGVTIEKKSGKLKTKEFEAEIIDLPGIYSLSTISLEEEIASRFVLERNADLIINIVDASNLERNLFLTYQLLDSGIPMVVVLNCMDIVEKKLQAIDVGLLADTLKVPVVAIAASKRRGIDGLIRYLASKDWEGISPVVSYPEPIESTIAVFNDYFQDRFKAIRFFEDGLKLLEPLKLDAKTNLLLTEAYQAEAKRHDLDFDMVIPNERYRQIIDLCEKVTTKPKIATSGTTEKIDRVLTHRIFGLPLFGLIMFSVFFLAFGPVGTWITDGFVAGLNWVFSQMANGIESLGMATWVSSLVTQGVFGGLASVVSFLPQLAILFLFLSILEDSGYMARAAFIMDRALRRFGLSGKSFIPMLLGFGCSVPAITATRTLDKEEDRKLTAMVIPFVSCGAKAPIYGVFAGALFFSNAFFMVFIMYLLGLLVAILSALLFKKTILKKASANYIMELPEYRMPSFNNTFRHTWERVKGFLVKAGTVLLVAFIIIWFFSYFGVIDGEFRLLDSSEIGESLLGTIGRFLLPLFQPIGIGDWRGIVALLTGIVAKESVVGTLGILYGVSGDAIQNGALLFQPIREAFTQASATAFMAFALLSTPCIAAIAAMKKELKSWKWLAFIIAYEMTIAYLVALLIYQIGSLPRGTAFSIIFAILLILFVLYTIIRLVTRKASICGSCGSCALKNNCVSSPSTPTEKKNKTDTRSDSHET